MKPCGTTSGCLGVAYRINRLRVLKAHHDVAGFGAGGRAVLIRIGTGVPLKPLGVLRIIQHPQCFKVIGLVGGGAVA